MTADKELDENYGDLRLKKSSNRLGDYSMVHFTYGNMFKCFSVATM